MSFQEWLGTIFNANLRWTALKLASSWDLAGIKVDSGAHYLDYIAWMQGSLVKNVSTSPTGGSLHHRPTGDILPHHPTGGESIRNPSPSINFETMNIERGRKSWRVACDLNSAVVYNCWVLSTADLESVHTWHEHARPTWNTVLSWFCANSLPFDHVLESGWKCYHVTYERSPGASPARF